MSQSLELSAKYENMLAFLDEIKVILEDLVRVKDLRFEIRILPDVPNFFKTDY